MVLDSTFGAELFVADQTSVLSRLKFTLRAQEMRSITTNPSSETTNSFDALLWF